MTETNEQDKKKTLELTKPGKLVLNKTVETGQVRQSFSRGRSKAVTVEVRKKRTYVTDSSGRMKKVGADGSSGGGDYDATGVNRSLTEGEKAVRVKALQEAKKAEELARIEAERLAVEEAEQRRLAEEAERVRLAEEAKRQAEEQRAAEELAASEPTDAVAAPTEEVKTEPAEATQTEKPEALPVPDQPVAETVPEQKAKAREEAGKSAESAKGKRLANEEESDSDEEARNRKKAGRADVKRVATPVRKTESRRRSGKLTIADALEGDQERTRSLAAVRRAREKEKQKRRLASQESQKIYREVVIPETITVQELANRMTERGTDVIKALMRMGVMATINQTVDPDTAELVVTEFGHTPKRVSEADVEVGMHGEEDAPESLKSRAPVVTVMGHVDHGKTSLLDALRQSDVVSGEAGGITQHIGAYQVQLPSGDRITFIDTPGHAAFTDMRARGAKVTDIVILVVAADDGVMPQTIEAINHAKAAGVPMIVAINKMDTPGADPQRVRMELLNHEVVVEAMGGETLDVEVSAKKRTGFDKLQEAILLQAEILDLKANPDRSAHGVVIEAKMERGLGTVATILVQRGTLRNGDVLVAGAEWGRVRALIDDRGNNIEEAGPGVPVEMLGLNGMPMAGDEIVAVENEGRAREISEFRQSTLRQARAKANTRGTLEQMFSRIREGEEVKEMPVVIKADVHGSTEAIVGALEKMSTEEVKVNVLHTGVGGINESDVTLANASGALIIGFNVRANPQAREAAKRDGVEIRYYSIIYDVTDDIKKALSGMMSPTLKETLLGYAEIQEVFNITKVGRIGGCKVTEGMVRRGSKVRLLRDDVVIHEGTLSQLKRFKDDVREVREGFECGMAFANYQDIQVGDFIECFDVEEVAREL